MVPQSEAVMNEEYSGTVESLMLEARRFLVLLLLKMLMSLHVTVVSTVHVSDSCGFT